MANTIDDILKEELSNPTLPGTPSMPDAYTGPYVGPKITSVGIPESFSFDGQSPASYDSLVKSLGQTRDPRLAVQDPISYKELLAEQRYKLYRPGVDWEDIYGQNQSNWDRAANGVLKGLNLAATTVVGGFGTVMGAGKSLFSGRLADIWDNPLMQLLDKWNTKVDQEYLPNFYTATERNATWYSPDNWFTANFLFDKLIKNSGFAVGAMIGGNIANAGLLRAGSALGKGASAIAGAAESSQAFRTFTPLLKNTARAFSAGKNIEAAAVLEKELSSIADLTARSSKIADIAKQTNAISEFSLGARRTAIAAYSSAGEASFEALQTANQYRENLIAEWKSKNFGEEPTPQVLSEINKKADAVGKTSFLGNMALLGITEYAQLPYLMGSTYRTSKRAANTLAGEVGEVVMRDGKYVAKETTNRFAKLYDKVTGVGRYVFDPKEAGQEIGQYALQVGTQNFFDKAYRTENADVWVDGFLYGMFGRDESGKAVGALVSKEGIESGILGGVTGGLMQARQKYAETRREATNTQRFLEELKPAPTFKDAFKDRLLSANRGIVLQEQEQNATMQGDEMEARDLRYDATYNYLAPRIKYGRMDMVMEDINDLRAASITEEGLASLKEQGMANIDDTIESYQERLNNFQTTARNIDEIYNSLSLRYGGVKTEDGKRKYSPYVIDKMTYAAAKIADYDVRIPEVNAKLSEAGIDTLDILQSIIKTFKPNKEATERAVNQINAMDSVYSEVRDSLKSALSDVIELSLRRKLFMEEYDMIKENPEEADLDSFYEFGETEELPVTVEQRIKEKRKRERIVERELEVGKEYSLQEPYLRSGNTIQLAPKLTVLSQTLGGEYEVRLPNGQITFLTPEDFRNYQVSEGTNDFPQLKDLLNKAVNKVLGKKKWQDIPKPPTPDAISHLNSLNNSELVNDVLKEFDKSAKEFMKDLKDKQSKSERMKQNADKLGKAQDDITTLTGEEPTGEDPVDSDFPPLAKEDMKKDEKKLFTSDTSASQDWETVLPPHIVRHAEFLQKAKNFKNRDALRAIQFTQNQEAALGVSGVAELSFRQGGLDVSTINDPKTGFVGLLFVEQGKNNKRYFVDKSGNRILDSTGKPIEVGQPVDINQIVFSTMPTTSLQWSNGENRYRNYQANQIEAYQNAWIKYRENLFNKAPNQYFIFEFGISRGIPNVNKKAPEKNFVGGTLVDENSLKTQTLVVIPKKGTVAHEDGNNYKFVSGRPVFVNGDDLAYLNNNAFSESRAKVIFAVLKKLSEDINRQLAGDQSININPNYYNFLVNVLYWNNKPGSKPSGNKIYINPETGMLVMGGKDEQGNVIETEYDFANIADYESQIVNRLKSAYHNVNSLTLDKGLAEPFVDFYLDKSGNLVERRWPNYQSFLVSSKNPDGSARSVDDAPLFTNISKPTESVPIAFKQKYAFLIGMDLGVQEIKEEAPPTPPPPGEAPVVDGAVLDNKSPNKYRINAINADIQYTAQYDENKGQVDVSIETKGANAAVMDAVMGNAELVENIKNIVPVATPDSDARVDIASRISTLISAKLTKAYNEKYKPKEQPPSAPPAAEQPPSPPPFPGEPPPTDQPGSFDLGNLDDDTEYRMVGVTGRAEAMSQAEMDFFERWSKKNVPGIPFKYLDNIITTHDGKEAWGKFENGVAQVFRKAAKGTGFHEIMEGVWKGFLSPAEQQALLAEFKANKGSFLDTVSGKRIDYNDATDLQAKERIMDDFADYMAGKIPARTLSGRILQFFKAIVEFFKSFVQKPSLKEQLFRDVFVGKFKKRVFPMERKMDNAEYKPIEGMTPEQINDFVQDMIVRTFDIIFSQNRSLFNIPEITSKEIFDSIKETYRKAISETQMTDAQYDQLVSRAKDYMRRYGLAFDENDRATINSEGANNRDYAPEAFTVNFKKTSPYAIKLLIGTLPRAERSSLVIEGEDKSPKLDRSTSSIGGYVLVPYSETFNTLMTTLSNARDENDFVNKLYNLAKRDPNYARLFKRLGGNLGTGKINFEGGRYRTDKHAWRLWVQFYEVFTKQKPDAFMQYVDGEKKYTASANLATATAQTVQDWTENMKRLADVQGSMIKVGANRREYILDKDSEKYKTIDAAFKDAKGTVGPAIMISFLNNLGIMFDAASYNKLTRKQAKEFAENVSGIKKGIDSVTKVMSLKSKALDLDGRAKAIARMYVAVNNPVEEGVFINNRGEQQQTFTESNAPSLFEYLFNSVETLDELKEKFPQLKDVFSANSLLLKKGGPLFDEDGVRISDSDVRVQYILGDINIKEADGSSISEMTIGKRMSLELNQNMRGRYYIVIPGDGSTEWMMNLGNQLPFSAFTSGIENASIRDVFIGYLRDDIQLALDGQRRRKINNIGNKAFDLRFFKELLPADLVNQIDTLIKSKDKDKMAKLEELVTQSADIVTQSVNNLINEEVENTKNLLLLNQEITMNSDGNYKFSGIEDNISDMYGLNKNNMTEEELTTFLRFLRTNFIINNIEYHKVLFGDPYQFKIKKDEKGKLVVDETKRIKSFLSPRRITYNTTAFNNFLNREFNKANDIALETTDFGYHAHKDFAKTFTARDIEVIGSLTSLFPKYVKTNEADAASWIMDGAYREVKMKNGEWSDEAEVWYQWQMAYTRNKLASKGVYTYTNPQLQTQDAEMIKKDPVSYVIEVLKPIVSGNKFGMDYFNMVLDKFSQMPLFYRAIEGTNLENLYIEMFRQGYDYVVVESGRKEGVEGLHDLYTKKGEFNKEAFNNVVNVPWQAYGIQVANAYDKEKLQTLGSQLTKLSTMDLFSNGEPVGEGVRKEVIRQAVNRNTEALKKAIANGYENLLKKLSIQDNGDGYVVTDNSVVSKTLRQELLNRNISENGIDSITINSQGRFEIPFEASTNYKQIKDILYSIVDKSITSRKVNGFSGVQIPVTMWENSGRGRSLAIKLKDAKGKITGYRKITAAEYDGLSEEDKKDVALTDDTLKFYEDANGRRRIQVLIPNWLRKKIPPGKFKDDKELLRYLNSEEGGKILRGIGFRIPTQGLNSMDVIEIVGFLPDFMGRSVVVPSEITTKSGSDFDIDKLNMYLKSIYIDAKGNIKYIKLLESEESTREFYRDVYNQTRLNEINRIDKFDDFRAKVVEIFEKIESLEEVTSESIAAKLGEQDYDFYLAHANILQDMVDQAATLNVNPSEYIIKQMERLAEVRLENQRELLNDLLREEYVDNMYTKALENEYFDSLEEILTLPENFSRLIQPLDNRELEDVSDEIEQLMGIDESAITSKMLRPTYLTQLRHAFVSTKRWIGIVAVNLTSHSLAQKAGVYIKDPGFNMALPHNEIIIDGKSRVSFSGVLDSAGKFISDKLSMYVNSFVDVVKNPYIIKYMFSEKLVGTVMFMERAGVPMRTTALFLNQPIIRRYIDYLDAKNVSVFKIENEDYINHIKTTFFPTSVDSLYVAEINPSESSLAKNISDYYRDGKKLTEQQVAEQHMILDEFIKYSKMADASFKMSMAINYDTSSFKNADDLFRKQIMTELTDQTSPFSSINRILENSFMGDLADALDRASDALGAILMFNKPQFRDILERAIRPYAKNIYVSKDKFTRIAEKLTASFLDYIIQTNMPSIDLKAMVVDETAVANRIAEAKVAYPNVKMLKFLKVESSDRIGGAKTVKLAMSSTEAYDEDMYIAYMREMKSNPETRELYNDLVKLGVIQGVYKTPVSFRNIIPLEDYAEIVAPIISTVSNRAITDNLLQFEREKMFQRNRFTDKTIVPNMVPTFYIEEMYDNEGNIMEPLIGLDANDEEIYQYSTKAFPEIPSLGVTPEQRKIMLIHPKKRNSNYPVVKVPRMLELNDRERIDFINGRTLSSAFIRERLERSDSTLSDVYGYKRLENSDGVPYVTSKGYYIYKQINLLGDGMYATEQKLFPTQSPINNSSVKIEDEIPDADILKALEAQLPQTQQEPVAINIAPITTPSYGAVLTEAEEVSAVEAEPTALAEPVAPQMTIRPVAPKKPGEPKTDKKAEEEAGKEKPPTPPSPSPTTPYGTPTVPPVATSKGFQGYKGGFENIGKGTIQGDGKDKAMRRVANSAIVELSSEKDSSSKTSLGQLGLPKEGDKVIMLARNGALSGNPLRQETKEQIRQANLDGAEFVVGDMPNVDSQFIDYLQEIGAKFTIYHTGDKSRITIPIKSTPPAPVSDIEAKKADIERRRYEEFKPYLLDDETSTWRGKSTEQLKKQVEEQLESTDEDYIRINAKYDAELAALGAPQTEDETLQTEEPPFDPDESFGIEEGFETSMISTATFEEFGTLYRFTLENGAVVNGEYKQGGQDWKTLSAKKVVSKYNDLVKKGLVTSQTTEEPGEFLPDGKPSILDERSTPIAYTEGQRKALEDIQKIIDKKDKGFYLLAGYAGTGKTTIAENIVKYAKRNKKEVHVLAPTNKAVKVLNDKLEDAGAPAQAATIHKAIYGQPDPDTGEWIPSTKIKNSVVIIDEFSMVNTEVLSDIVSNLSGSNIVIFMGDGFQLEPVGKDPGVFKGEVEQVRDSRTELTEVKRQSLDSNILKLATLIRTDGVGYVPSESIPDFQVIKSKNDFVNEFKKSIKNNEDSVMIVATNNERLLMNNIAREVRFGQGAKVVMPGETLISIANSADFPNSDIFNIEKPVEGSFSKHTLAIETKGKTQEYVMYFGKILLSDGRERPVLLAPTFDGPSLYHAVLWKAIKASDADLYNKLIQNNLITSTKKGEKLNPMLTVATYGYSITAHKSQGSQWKKVFVNQNYVANTWNPARWFYTAITRSSKDVVVFPTSSNRFITPAEMDKKISEVTKPADSAKPANIVIPKYELDYNLSNSDGTKRLASTNGITILLNPVKSLNEFYDYFQGLVDGPSSRQKKIVLERINAQGWSLDRIKGLLNTNKLINTFLVLHEQDHIDHNDVQRAKGKDKMSEEVIDIEVRATVNALEKVAQMKSDEKDPFSC